MAFMETLREELSGPENKRERIEFIVYLMLMTALASSLGLRFNKTS